MNKVNHPSEVVSVGDIVKVYVAEVDAERNRVQLSLLPLEDLNKRKQLQKESYKKQNHKKQNKPQRNEKPQKKEVSMEEATRRLLERFGR